MTYPQIGNYGINPEDAESSQPHIRAFVIGELCRIPSSWRSTQTLDAYLASHGVLGIEGIDTRALTRHLRDHGAQMGMITTTKDPLPALLEKLRRGEGLVGRDIVKEVTTDKTYVWPLSEEPAPAPKKKYRVAVYDFGVKFSILRSLYKSGCELAVFPARTPPDKILAWKPDGIFLSNGPGDPAALKYAHEAVADLIKTYPVFGICLGHQIITHAIGASTYKLKFGHRGGNQPVKNTEEDRVSITAQNHGFASKREDLERCGAVVTEVNLNDDTVSGLRLKDKPVFSVQYHPEAGPGPNDADVLFDRFYDLIAKSKAGK